MNMERNKTAGARLKIDREFALASDIIAAGVAGHAGADRNFKTRDV